MLLSFLLNIYLFIYLVAQVYLFGCDMWDLVPWPGIEPGSPALGAQSLSHWTTRQVPVLLSFLVCADFLPRSPVSVAWKL